MKKTMKCLVKIAPEVDALEIQERPVPVPGRNEVLVKVNLAAICGTDVHIKKWNNFAQKRMVPPVIMGHEFCGEIVQVGADVNENRIGEKVSAETHIACYSCPLCLDGKPNICIHTKGIGLHVDGCFAEYIKIPAINAITTGSELPEQSTAVLEPLGVAVYACSMANVAGKSVAIVGCGPIGLMTVKVARQMGAKKIICIELNELRMNTAGKMGADMVVNPLKEDTVALLKNACDGLGPEVVLEFSGSVPGIVAATQFIRAGGDMIAAGLPSTDVPINFTEVFYRGVTIHGISGRQMFSTWKTMIGLLKAGLDISQSISHVLPLEEYDKAFALIDSGDALKVLLKP